MYGTPALALAPIRFLPAPARDAGVRAPHPAARPVLEAGASSGASGEALLSRYERLLEHGNICAAHALKAAEQRNFYRRWNRASRAIRMALRARRDLVALLSRGLQGGLDVS